MKSDLAWKIVIERFFPNFVLFFMPDLHNDIDYNKEIRFLEQELSKLFKKSDEKFRKSDKLVEVTLKNGTKRIILIHIEIQGYYDKEFEKRMFTYYYRIYDRFKKDITSIAIFTESRKNYKPDKFQQINYGTELTYKYNVCKIMDLNEAELLKSENVFALAVLAVFYVIKAKKDNNLRYNFKIELAKLLCGRNYTELYLDELLRFIDSILEISDDFKNEIFYGEVREMAVKEKKPELLSSLDRIAIKRGLESGLKQGLEQGLEQGKKQIAKKMKLKGLDIQLIEDLTGLTKEEIDKI